jgi:hypothetical protein
LSVLYVGDVRTSQEAQTSTAFYRDSFTVLYVNDVGTLQGIHYRTLWPFTRWVYFLYVDVRTSQDAHRCPTTACDRDGFTFMHVDDHISGR